ncbi:MAG: hypothetical protein LBR79_03330 [Oscillospiraceae bacterium]|nr:hypothetical protein [Oscillospiraceae bacterium]
MVLFTFPPAEGGGKTKNVTVSKGFYYTVFSQLCLKIIGTFSFFPPLTPRGRNVIGVVKNVDDTLW